MKRSHKFLKLLWMALAISQVALLSSCQRSPQFRKEEDYGRSDLVSGTRSIQQIESMNQLKKKAMVLNFSNETPVNQANFGAYAADELKRGLFLSQKVIVPPDLKTQTGTEDFLQGDRVKVSQLIREGRRLGVSVLVIGRISKITVRQKGDDIGILRQKQSIAGVQLDAKLFDVQGGREVMSTSKFGESTQSAFLATEDGNTEGSTAKNELIQLAIQEAVAGFVPEVLKTIDKMMWQGRIAKLMGQRAYINAGQASGLIAGDILRVLTPGDDIYDPITGAYLGRSRGQLKGTLEVVDFIGPDSAVAVIHTGSKPKEGDTVQLY